MAFGDVVGSGLTQGVSGQNPTISISTSAASRIVVGFLVNGARCDSISDDIGQSITWNLVGRSDVGAFTNKLEVWEGVSSASFSGKTITINLNISSAYVTAVAMALEGVDAGGSAIDGSVDAGAAAPLSVTTSTADTVVVGAFRFGATADASAGSGFTEVGTNAGFFLMEKKVLASAATTSVTTSNDGDVNGGVAFAFKKAAGGAITLAGSAATSAQGAPAIVVSVAL